MGMDAYWTIAAREPRRASEVKLTAFIDDLHRYATIDQRFTLTSSPTAAMSRSGVDTGFPRPPEIGATWSMGRTWLRGASSTAGVANAVAVPALAAPATYEPFNGSWAPYRELVVPDRWEEGRWTTPGPVEDGCGA